MQHDTPHTWWVHLTSGQKGQMAVGEKGKQLAELAPCTFAACDRSKLAATWKAKFAHTKIISSEAIMGIKLKLCRIVHNIRLYKSCFLLPLRMYFRYYGNLHWHIRGKVKVDIYYYLILDILTKVFWKMFLKWSNITVCPNLSIWLVVMATKRLNFRKNTEDFRKSTSQKLYGG